MNRKFSRIVRWGSGAVLAACLSSGIATVSAQTNNNTTFAEPSKSAAPAPTTARGTIVPVQYASPAPPKTSSIPTAPARSAQAEAPIPQAGLGEPTYPVMPRAEGKSGTAVILNPRADSIAPATQYAPRPSNSQPVYRPLPSGKSYPTAQVQSRYQPAAPAQRSGLFNGAIIRRISSFFSGGSTEPQTPDYPPYRTEGIVQPHQYGSGINWSSVPKGNPPHQTQRAPITEPRPSVAQPTPRPSYEPQRQQTQLFPRLFGNRTTSRQQADQTPPEMRKPSVQQLQHVIQQACGKSVRLTSLRLNQKGELEMHFQARSQQDWEQALNRIVSNPEVNLYQHEYHVKIEQ